MKDNENNLREGGRQDQDLPLSLRVCSANEHNNNLKEPKSPANENEASQEDSSFQNTNFVSGFSLVPLPINLLEVASVALHELETLN